MSSARRVHGGVSGNLTGTRAAEDVGPYHRKDSVGTQTITPHRRENVL